MVACWGGQRQGRDEGAHGSTERRDHRLRGVRDRTEAKEVRRACGSEILGTGCSTSSCPPLVASRHETTATIVTSSQAFSPWGDIFADEVVAAAIVDRIVHHADVIDATEHPPV